MTKTRNPRKNAPSCSGTAKSTGQPCQNPAMPNGKCYVHGGPTPKGLASANTKHGRYSADLLTNLKGSYREELEDQWLTELRDEIALTRTYLREILRMGGSGKGWQEVDYAVAALDKVIRNGNASGIEPAMEKLQGIIGQGRDDWAHRNEIVRRIEVIRRLAACEHKHRIDNRLAVSYEQMVTTISAFVDIVDRHVDADQLHAITSEVDKLIMGLGHDRELN
jgi:hypothetical protein